MKTKEEEGFICAVCNKSSLIHDGIYECMPSPVSQDKECACHEPHTSSMVVHTKKKCYLKCNCGCHTSIHSDEEMKKYGCDICIDNIHEEREEKGAIMDYNPEDPSQYTPVSQDESWNGKCHNCENRLICANCNHTPNIKELISLAEQKGYGQGYEFARDELKLSLDIFPEMTAKELLDMVGINKK